MLHPQYIRDPATGFPVVATYNLEQHLHPQDAQTRVINGLGKLAKAAGLGGLHVVQTMMWNTGRLQTWADAGMEFTPNVVPHKEMCELPHVLQESRPPRRVLKTVLWRPHPRADAAVTAAMAKEAKEVKAKDAEAKVR